MKRIKTISKFILAIFMLGAGVMHFVTPGFFMRIMPPYFPFHRELVMVSGVGHFASGPAGISTRRMGSHSPLDRRVSG